MAENVMNDPVWTEALETLKARGAGFAPLTDEELESITGGKSPHPNAPKKNYTRCPHCNAKVRKTVGDAILHMLQCEQGQANSW